MENRQMTLERNLEMCQKLLDKIGVPYGEVTKIKINSKARSRWGQCRRLSPEKFEIEISSRLLEEGVSQKTLWNTMLHELLHTAPGCMNHGSKWKAYAAKVNAWGYEIKTSATSKELNIPDDPTEFRYHIICESCGITSRYRVKSPIVKSIMEDRRRCFCSKCRSYDLKVREIFPAESEPQGEILRKVAHAEKKTGGDMYITKEGKTLNGSNMISRSRQEKMIQDGWTIVHVDPRESAQKAYDRISDERPGRIVRIYSNTTRVRGYHDKYAMVRWPRSSKKEV